LRQGKRSDGKVSTENGPVYYYLDKDTTLVNAIKDLGYDSIMGIEDNTNTYALFEPTQVKSIYNKGTFDINNNDIRYQESAKQDKSEEREEKEYNKRKERVEKAKEEGTLSDQMKDVYSVSFTKSAQEYAENRTKMEYFDNNEDYWDRTEDKSTGKVTYVRKTPYEHQ
jgi:hypothetical protein